MKYEIQAAVPEADGKDAVDAVYVGLADLVIHAVQLAKSCYSLIVGRTVFGSEVR